MRMHNWMRSYNTGSPLCLVAEQRVAIHSGRIACEQTGWRQLPAAVVIYQSSSARTRRLEIVSENALGPEDGNG